MKATVYFTQIYEYVVDLPDGIAQEDMYDEAISLAEEDFIYEMCRPIAHCDYDQVEVEFEE